MSDLTHDVLEGWQARYEGEDSPVGLPLNSTSNALEASRVVKAGAGTLFGASGFNSNAGAQFILIFDANSVPANGATAVCVIRVLTVTNFSIDFGVYGRAFRTGIVLCNSSTEPTLTIGAADTFFDAQYL